MEMVPLMLRIMNSDEKFMHLQEQIDNHEQLQLTNSMNLNALTKENNFLEHVREDYKKFSDIIVQQKRDQVKALEMLAITGIAADVRTAAVTSLLSARHSRRAALTPRSPVTARRSSFFPPNQV